MGIIKGNVSPSVCLGRYLKFDHHYIKKWLLREQPEEKHDLRLWQTFRNIDLQTAIRLHEETSGNKQNVASNSPKILAIVQPPNDNNRKTSILPVMSVPPFRTHCSNLHYLLVLLLTIIELVFHRMKMNFHHLYIRIISKIYCNQQCMIHVDEYERISWNTYRLVIF